MQIPILSNPFSIKLADYHTSRARFSHRQTIARRDRDATTPSSVGGILYSLSSILMVA